MQATYVTQDRLEFLKNVSYDDPALSPGNHLEGAEVIKGMTFNRSYNVTEVNDPNGNYLRIDYTVAWNDGVDHRISFSTIRSQ